MALVVLAGCRAATSEAPIADSASNTPAVQTAAAASSSSAAALGSAPPADSAAIVSVPGVDGVGVPGANVVIGQGLTVKNLTVFPVVAASQVDLGPITTLEAALKKGKAVVREVGAESEARRRDGEHVAIEAGSATVGTIVIENKGSEPIYVLAGTIIRGGNQDRQIAQDFIVEPRQVTPVGAFCVEQGRWNEVRDGSATGGRFTTAGKLAVSDVRTAAQYDRDQSKVWSNVAEVNRKHGKGASTGTLLATLDDAAIERQLLPFASELRARLAAVEPQGQVVGLPTPSTASSAARAGSRIAKSSSCSATHSRPPLRSRPSLPSPTRPPRRRSRLPTSSRA
jgi:hypothetical protein